MWRICTIAAVSVAMLAGCGSEAGDREVAAQAEAVCERRLPALEGLMAPWRLRRLGLSGWAAEGRAAVKALESDLRRIVRRRAGDGRYAELVATLAETDEAFGEVQRRVGWQDHAPARRRAAKVGAIVRDAERAAADLGLAACERAARTLAGARSGA